MISLIGIRVYHLFTIKSKLLFFFKFDSERGKLYSLFYYHFCPVLYKFHILAYVSRNLHFPFILSLKKVQFTYKFVFVGLDGPGL